MKWALCLVESGIEGAPRSIEVLEIDRPGDLDDLAALGLTHAQGKQLRARVQPAIVTAQCRDHAARRPSCRSCGLACRVKDYRPRRIATLFGEVTVGKLGSGFGELFQTGADPVTDLARAA